MLALSYLEGYGLREIARGFGDLLTGSPPHQGEDIQLFSISFTALTGEEVSFRETAIFATHWLTGVSEPQLRCDLERPSAVAAADARLFSMLSTTPCACVLLTLCASVTFARSCSLDFLEHAAAPRGADLHWRQLLTNEGTAPSSTSQFDLVIDDVGRLR
jgi:hypothetical protein